MTRAGAAEFGDVVLRVDGLRKLYARRQAPTRARLGGLMLRALTGGRPAPVGALKDKEFWALNDISFDLRRSEALGVIGLNGSGKTTLLRILAGQLLPDGGEVSIVGKTAAMIDLQAGFQPAASGRENIFLRAAALGVARAEALRRLDEIIDFSELGDAIDAPMASYSSGMKMRLAFSVMAMVEPDILLIDEVLSVGDFRFRQKSLAKIREMRDRCAFVFVSHSMANIHRFCDRVVVLKAGEVDFMGPPDKAIAHFLKGQHDDEFAQVAVSAKAAARAQDCVTKTPDAYATHNSAAAVKLGLFSPNPFHDKSAIGRIGFSVDGKLTEHVRKESLSSLRFEVTTDVLRPCRRLIFGFTILTEAGEGISGIASDSQDKGLSLSNASTVVATVSISALTLNPGQYSIYFNIRDGVELLFRSELFKVFIHTPAHNTFGIVTVPHSWELSIASNANAIP